MSRGRDDPRGGALDSTNEGVGLDGPLRMSVGRNGPSRSGEPVGQCERREGGGMAGHDHQGHAGPDLEGELVDHRTRRSLSGGRARRSQDSTVLWEGLGGSTVSVIIIINFNHFISQSGNAIECRDGSEAKVETLLAFGGQGRDFTRLRRPRSRLYSPSEANGMGN